uniref:N-methyltransferase n=1 Tax=Leptobrachium leishanense TaxID=445787 RepID=A0A8C5RAI5_9ANUR
MSSISHKFYHLHDMDPQAINDVYAGDCAEQRYLDEIIFFPLKAIYKILESGHIKGDTMIDLSTGPCICQLFPFCNIFKDFIILEFNESCMKTLQKWLHKEPGALNWSHVAKITAELEGSSMKPEEIEDNLRKRVKHILKCDTTNENLTDPVIIRNADCVFSFYVLEHISENLDALHANLKKMSSMLKPGGRLILATAINGTHFTVAEHKYHILNYNEADLRATLKNTEFSLEHLEMMESKIRSDIIYYEHIVIASAVKKGSCDSILC